MEQVFDLREFILTLLRKGRILLLLAVLFGLLGGCYGVFAAGRAVGGEDTYTATSAASVNIVSSPQTTQWTPSSIMSTVDAMVGSDFIYINFADVLRDNGMEDLLNGIEAPNASEMKGIAKFYVKGNLLLADIVTNDQELSRRASEAAISYLAASVPSLLNHVVVMPQDKQTITMVAQEAPSKLQKAVKFGILGAGGGFVLGFLWVFFFDVFDLRVRREEDLRRFGLPILGVAPKGGKSK